MASLELSEIVPSATFVIFTGFVSSLSDTLIFPSAVAENFGPSLLPICTVLKEGFSTVAKIILPFVLCVTSRFLPAIISIVLPALMDSPVAVTVLPVFLVPPVIALAFNVKAALFTASTTESTVAILPVSPFVTFIVPGVVPASIPPVTTFNPLSPVVIVVLSVFAFKPAVVTSNDLSAGVTVILLSVVFSKPLPRFTLYFTVDVLPSFVVATATEVPSPSMKFTVSYGFTKSFATPFSCKFQPAFNTSPTVAALFLFTSSAPVPNVGAVALVVGASVPALAPCKLPATFVIGLPPLFNPFWFNVTVFSVVPAGFVMVIPVGVIFTLLSPSLNSALVKPVNAGFKE